MPSQSPLITQVQNVGGVYLQADMFPFTGMNINLGYAMNLPCNGYVTGPMLPLKKHLLQRTRYFPCH